MAWVAQTTPFDGLAGAFIYKGCYSAGLTRLAITGSDGTNQGHVLTSDDSGATWVDRGLILPFGAQGIAYADAIGLFVLGGLDVGPSPAVAVSADGITWGAPVAAFSVTLTSLKSNVVGDLLVAGDVSGGIWTSVDGTTWLAQASPFASLTQVKWVDELGLWYAVGAGAGGTEAIATSPDAIIWTIVPATPFTAGSATSVAYNAATNQIFVSGYDAGSNYLIARSPDGGATWTTDVTPFDVTGYVYNLAAVGALILAGGSTAGGANVAAETPGDGSYATQATPLDGGFAFDDLYIPGGAFLFGESPGNTTLIAFTVAAATAPFAPVLSPIAAGNTVNDLTWSTPFDGGSAITGYNVYRGLAPGGEVLLTSVGVTNTYHDAGLTDGVTYYYKVSAVNVVGESALSNEEAGTPLLNARRFQIGHQWRFVVTELDMTTLTFLDRLAENRAVVYTLNAPAVATGNVPSDNPQVNILAGDGDPYVSYSNRLLFGFRREGGTPPWVCRFAGILMQLEDAATTEVPSSLYTAYDPWQYLLSRPIRDKDGNLPGPNGLTFSGSETTLDQIAVDLINRTIIADGTVYTDTVSGTIESIGFSEKINFQRGLSVGDALTQICNSGLCDIWFSPVYDPVGSPGIIAVLNIFIQQGATRNSAIFAWDAPSKSLVGISRLLDGAQLGNEIQFYYGQGGSPVPLQTGAGSIAKYGKYWALQFIPGQNKEAAVEALAAEQLLLRQFGRRTIAINPAPERSPDPFTEYFLGDLCPIYATKRLRQTLPVPGEPTNYTRIYGIPVTIPNDAPETVQQLLTSPDGFTP